jgi:hypothetical protein
MMKQVQFSRTGKRRFNSRVNSLVALFKKDERVFRREWQKLMQGWLNEVHRRAKNWREGAEFRNIEGLDGPIEQGRTHIFGVLEIAETMLSACGDDVEKLVGSETRRALTNECVKAVAILCDGRLNHMVDHRVYRQAKYS